MDKVKLHDIKMKFTFSDGEYLNKEIAPTIAYYESRLILISRDNKEICRMPLEYFHINPWDCSKSKISRFQIRYIKGDKNFLAAQDANNEFFYKKMILFFSCNLADDKDCKIDHDCGWLYKKLGNRMLRSDPEYIRSGVQLSFEGAYGDELMLYHFGVLLGFVEHNCICINKHGNKGPIFVNSAQQVSRAYEVSSMYVTNVDGKFVKIATMKKDDIKYLYHIHNITLENRAQEFSIDLPRKSKRKCFWRDNFLNLMSML